MKDLSYQAVMDRSGEIMKTSLTAAFALASQMAEDEIIVVQETEYTGAGKSPLPQLAFARQNGIDVRFGDPDEEIPGTNIILPDHPSALKVRHADLDKVSRSYIKNAVSEAGVSRVTEEDMIFLVTETRHSRKFVEECLEEMGVGYPS